MKKYTTWVQAIVDQSLYPFIPGATIRLWGHDFKIYPNRKLCMRMHNDFIASETKAGHVTVMNSPPPGVVEVETPKEDTKIETKDDVPEQKKVEIKIDLPDFTMDIGSYFGHGNMTKLMDKIGKLTVPEIRSFAKERFQKTFPVRASKDEILDEVRTLTDRAVIRIIEEQEDTDE